MNSNNTQFASFHKISGLTHVATVGTLIQKSFKMNGLVSKIRLDILYKMFNFGWKMFDV